jgi:SAM-dependent methyltransferase
LCFEQLPAEPKKIIHLGGCQQADLARRLGFLLPFAGITVTDTDAEVVRVTEEAIHCRLGFEQAPLPQLPMARDSADVILLPNMGQTPISEHDWPTFITECRRVLRPGGHLILSAYRPAVGAMLSMLPGAKAVFELLQMPPPVTPLMPWQISLSAAKQYGGTLTMELRPLPWHMAMVKMG